MAEIYIVYIIYTWGYVYGYVYVYIYNMYFYLCNNPEICHIFIVNVQNVQSYKLG